MEARFQRIPGGPHDDRDQVQEGVHQQENDQRAIGHNGGLHALVAEHTRDTIGLRKHTAVDEYERDGEPPRTQHTLNVGRNAGPQEHVRVSHNDADQGQHTEERTAEEAQSAVSKSWAEGEERTRTTNKKKRKKERKKEMEPYLA
jgi:hypothetical protein